MLIKPKLSDSPARIAQFRFNILSSCVAVRKAHCCLFGCPSPVGQGYFKKIRNSLLLNELMFLSKQQNNACSWVQCGRRYHPATRILSVNRSPDGTASHIGINYKHYSVLSIKTLTHLIKRSYVFSWNSPVPKRRQATRTPKRCAQYLMNYSG